MPTSTARVLPYVCTCNIEVCTIDSDHVKLWGIPAALKLSTALRTARTISGVMPRRTLESVPMSLHISRLQMATLLCLGCPPILPLGLSFVETRLMIAYICYDKLLF